tara:strand:+ start:597 stop:1832 length:1236 start_codon:yes stop_codon:yes gene_type:complete
MNDINLNLSPKFAPLFEMDGNSFSTVVITGGRFSSKSFAASLASIVSTIKYNHRVFYSRYTSASLRDSIFAEVVEKIEMLGMQNAFDIQQSRIVSKFNNSQILFKGLKAGSGGQSANLKGMSNFSMLIIDEAEEIPDEATYDKLSLSIRGNSKDDEYGNVRVLILNPATKENFIYKKFFERKGVREGFNGIKDGVCYIHTSYLDCLEHVPDDILNHFEEMKIQNPKKYEHIVLGGWLNSAEGTVYPNWEFGAFNPDGLQVTYGQDFGFSDPNTLVGVAIDKKKKLMYVKEELYQGGLTNSELASINMNRCGRNLIIGDSASAGTINELRTLGCNIVGAKKGAGSIDTGIRLIQDYKIVLEENSSNVANELNNYVYNDKKSGSVCDMYNHSLDALRYVALYHLSSSGKIQIR